ncbi:MAG: DUF2760 domain-containing protein [Methylococcaceae bacterium]|jgi:hypothetical protein|nr:DUF2760 domain-containing protein [Methylococcaceae bacterium]MDD1631534.1 DUF2760 domain-containing protein [Methylococcaceae bacterium]MDD1636567.1 DUF2760 domain-containing protein [Methylococcaceae bacterium]MDD1642473.1 DUF2760 domain-containing protein [Methylococcaceae bacterium]OYV17197.1 MAG: hypothetical protein CG441_1509 [Methylococcaceae bacterium NSM2-1]
MNPTYAIDLSLKPTTFDLWHVCLAGTVVLLSLILIVLLLAMVVSLARGKNKPAEPFIQQAAPTPEPVVKIVEKIVEVEKLVHAPAPEPVILKESTPDAALQLLGLLQKEARFIDFIKEDIATYSDADIGVAARVVHEGCNKALNEHFTLAPIRSEQEGGKITLPQGFDASSVRLTGNIVGSAPFTGKLIHKGWQVTNIRLPKLTQGHNATILAAAEVEL